MNLSLTKNNYVFLTVFLTLFIIPISRATQSGNLKFATDELSVYFGGKYNTETYFAEDLNFLNSSLGHDSLFFIRTTFDFFTTFKHGDQDQPRLVFYDTLRFRFKWGSTTDVKNADSSVMIDTTPITVSGTTVNKHLMWMRESWLKVMVGPLNDSHNFIQIGLIPYQVGRGISLGAAYQSTGFLGFNPGSSIEQFAPAILLSFNPLPDRFLTDLYFACTQNNQTSLSENIEPINEHQVGACPGRGLGRQAFIVVLRNETVLFKQNKNRVSIEPYIVHQKAPDQSLEYRNDVNTTLSTIGAAIEGCAARLSWGIEGACNFGDLEIKPWDRNYTKIVKNNDAFIVEEYTKVYTQDPATTIDPAKALVTKDITTFLKGSPQDRSENGKYIGTVDNTPLYNAFDRFRPEQRRILCGYFFVADAMYAFVPNCFNMAVGLGYASGDIDSQQDTNKLTQDQLLNERFTSFLPIQSVYSGKRLRHLVLFNEGVPRFNVKLPNADLSRANVTGILTPGVVNSMTNIAFLGTRFDWKIQALRKNEVNIAQNIICYWAPETAQFTKKPKDSELDSQGLPLPSYVPGLEYSSNFIGTEFATEFSAMFYENVKLSGYFGVLFPGQHYADMSGTVIKKNQGVSGNDIGYVCNISAAYFF